MSDTFLLHLPAYFLRFPCERYAALDQFGWIQLNTSLTKHSFVAMKPPSSAYFDPLNCEEEDYALRYRDAPIQLDQLQHLSAATNKSTADIAALIIDIMAVFDNKDAKYNNTYCQTYVDTNAALLIVEYVAKEAKENPNQAHFRWTQIRERQNNSTDWMIYHSLVINIKSYMSNMIVLDERPTWELLSQDQPANLVSGSSGVTLWNSLVQSFDSECVTLGVAALVIPVF